MAANESTVEDEDGDASDWIELYNGTDAEIDLAGWFLSDDASQPRKWMLPGRRLGSGRCLLVFASGKDRRAPDGVLHSNFKLGRKGGHLRLTKPHGITAAAVVDYGAQSDDVSYGLIDGRLGFLAEATPGAGNRGGFADGGPCGQVAFSRGGEMVRDGAFGLELGADDREAVIRYTVDGSEPDADSPAYAGGVAIAASTTVRARAFRPNHLPGPVSGESYVFLDDGLADFSSNLPVIVVETFGRDVAAYDDPHDARPYQPAALSVFAPGAEDARARLDSVPEFAGRAGLHVRGRSSAMFPKKQYALELWDERDRDRKEKILDFAKASDFVLHAPYADKTLMRNALVYRLARKVGGNGAAVRTRFVELFYSQRGGKVTVADYAGVYILMERIGKQMEGADIERLGEFNTRPDELPGGYIFKKDPPDGRAAFVTPVERQRLEFVYPKEPNPEQAAWLEAHLAEFERALHSGDGHGPGKDYRDFIDLRAFVLNHLFIEIFRNVDAYRASLYFTKSRGGRIMPFPLWDYNLSSGNAAIRNGTLAEGWAYDGLTPYPKAERPDYPWYPALFQDPEFSEAYRSEYRRLRESDLSDGAIMAEIDAMRDELAEAQDRNFKRWKILGRYVWPNGRDFAERQTWEAEVQALKSWLGTRLRWMDSQLLR